MPQKEITVIPAIKPMFSSQITATKSKRRVAAYARVSTDSDEQLTSYEAQIDYYTKFIKSKEEYIFVNVYTDEGISATNTKRREGFNQMIADALDGQIDLIVTKSVSRFARNTVDSLVTIRKLKEKGIEVYFEKENIWTLDSKGELLITIMSSLAQEESRSISENVTWGRRKRFADGKVSVAYKAFLGYDKGANGTMVVNEEQAETIKFIYREFMKGKTTVEIATVLTNNRVLTPSGKSSVWNHKTVRSILMNEKYKGSALLQKTFTIDFLTKKIKKNEGEIPQYYVEHSHEAIIPADEWELVQHELKRRRAMNHGYSGGSIFSTRITCGDCGAYFGPKVLHSTSPTCRKNVWRCNEKYNNYENCKTPNITDDEIKAKFVTAFNIVYDIKDDVIENLESLIDSVADIKAIDNEIYELREDLELTSAKMEKYIYENASQALDQEEYTERYNTLSKKHEELHERLTLLSYEKEENIAKKTKMKMYLEILKLQEGPLVVFDEPLWLTVVETVKVMADKSFIFVFKDGSEITV